MINQRTNDYVSMQKQKQILQLHEELLNDPQATLARIEAVNYKMFEQLRAVSSAGLKPILIRRNNAEWIAAYLVQEIGAGGWRILLKHQNHKWELSRARKSAEIVHVKKEQMKAFDLILTRQIGYLSALESFFSSQKKKRELVNV